MKSFFIGTILIFSFISCNESPITDIGEANLSETYGVVSSATPEATDAGTSILNKGGNAIDAAIAVSFALGVTEPAMSGLGGGTQIILAKPGEIPVSVNGATLSPVGTPPNATEEDLKYHRRSTIPSTVKVMGYVFENYGSGKVSWQELLAPAIEYASEGFAMGEFRHKVYKNYERQLKESPYNTSLFLLPDGNIPAPGDTLKQPVLAETLRRLAQLGPDEFYHGEMARQIANDMQANGGWITLEDLNNFPDPVELAPVHTTFRGYDVYSQPPPCGGWTMLLILNMLDQYDPDELQPGTLSRFEKVINAVQSAHQERKLYPTLESRGLETRLSKDYARELLSKNSSSGGDDKNDEGGETTHFSVIDQDGLSVAVTSSINAYFGAAAASPELGFLYNTYMNDFEFNVDKSHPYAIGPWKMNYSSMSPTIVQEANQTRLIIGSPGSARIISSVAQLIQLWADTEMELEEVVAYPRIHGINRKVYLEDLKTSMEWLGMLRNKGYEISFPSYSLTKNHLNAYFGGVHAISLKRHKIEGSSDPRRDGTSKSSH